MSKVSAALLLVVLSAAMPSALGDGGCGGRKVTIQNLSGRDLLLKLEPLANSPLFFPVSGYLLRHGTHAEFPVCIWTGRLKAPDAPTAEFHIGPEGGAWYMAPVAQTTPVRVSVTPHGKLDGHCPAVGCRNAGVCFKDQVPGGNCHHVDELKFIYYNPQ
ncbi:hypothetical protein EJB05_00974, partial [Eragrostis curvula]